MTETLELSPERIQILLTEYEQIQQKKRFYLKLLLEVVILYLTITGIAAGFVLQEPGITANMIMVAFFDIVVGAIGASIMFIGKREWKGSEKRLEKICSKLDIEYEGYKKIWWAIWLIFFCYLFVVAGWIITFIIRWN